MIEERYYVAIDHQRGDFGMGRYYTLKEWREQAIDWADMDENDDLIAVLETIKDEKLLDFISEIWDIEFAKAQNKVNNKHDIDFYWTLSGDINKVDILDSNGNYFDDLYYDDEEDIKHIIETLENTSLEEMCNFFAMKTIYNSLEELQYDLQDPEITEDNDYLNIFKVNDKKYYVWSE